MSDGRFSATLLWVRQGAGPEMDCPHSLFELSLDDGHPRTLDHHQCRRLLKPALLDAGEVHRQALETADVFQAFAVFALLLQRRAGYAVTREVTIPKQGSGAIAAVEHIWAPAAQWAGGLAAQFVDIACGRLVTTDQNVADAVLAYETACKPGPRLDHRYLYLAARQRGLPAVLKPPFDLVLGHGRNQRRLHRMMTDRTPHLAFRLASSKTRTLHMLHEAGLPVPRHVPAANVAEAQTAAQQIGFPVVVKPVNTDRGVGITVGVTSGQSLEQAYRHARGFDVEVAVEEFIPGETFRLVVVDGRFIAAACTQPTPVMGDGKSTVRDILTRINMSTMRGPGHQKPLTWIELDEEAQEILKSQSLTPDSVLPFGRTIRLRSASNLSRGGQSVSVTESVHPDNRALAETCAQVIGLDIAGIDFRSGAIDKSWQEGHGAVIEVNPSPGLRMHIHPARGQDADLATPILDLLYPDGAQSRIPIVAVTGTNGKTTTTRLIAHMLTSAGLVTGVTTTDDTVVGGKVIQRGDCAGAGFARRVLSVPTVEAAVLETARGGLIKFGLGFDRCAVAVVTNIAADHLGELGVETLEDLARVKLTVPLSAERVVLNADNSQCLAMRSALAGKTIVLFSASPDNPAVQEHLRGGGTAYVLGAARPGQSILRLEGEGSTALIAVADIPITFNGSARHNAENALAAFAAVHCLGIPDTTASEAAREFRPDPESNLGRLNSLPGFPFEVIVDYAHNRHGFAAIAAFASHRPCRGRRLCVVTMNASRMTGETACDAMTALAGHFDHYVACNHDSPKKRRDGFSHILQKGLSAAGVAEHAISVCEGEDEAIDKALALARPGDLVMILIGYEPQRVVDTLRDRASRFAVTGLDKNSEPTTRRDAGGDAQCRP